MHWFASVLVVSWFFSSLSRHAWPSWLDSWPMARWRHPASNPTQGAGGQAGLIGRHLSAARPIRPWGTHRAAPRRAPSKKMTQPIRSWGMHPIAHASDHGACIGARTIEEDDPAHREDDQQRAAPRLCVLGNGLGESIAAAAAAQDADHARQEPREQDDLRRRRSTDSNWILVGCSDLGASQQEAAAHAAAQARTGPMRMGCVRCASLFQVPRCVPRMPDDGHACGAAPMACAHITYELRDSPCPPGCGRYPQTRW